MCKTSEETIQNPIGILALTHNFIKTKTNSELLWCSDAVQFSKLNTVLLQYNVDINNECNFTALLISITLAERQWPMQTQKVSN